MPSLQYLWEMLSENGSSLPLVEQLHRRPQSEILLFTSCLSKHGGVLCSRRLLQFNLWNNYTWEAIQIRAFMENSAFNFLDCICFSYYSILAFPHQSHLSESHYNRSLIARINQHSFGIPLSGIIIHFSKNM